MLASESTGETGPGLNATRPIPGAHREFFEKKIRPVLVEHCYRCHAQDSDPLQGGLLLDQREGTRAGGDSGPAVVPGNVDESLLINALRYEDFEMPPAGQLSDEIIKDFETWIASGAYDPRQGDASIRKPGWDLDAAREFWSFRPRHSTVPTDLADTDWARNDIDRFVQHRLEAVGLKPVADADRATLLRRVHYALTGLPPTLQEIDAFLDDPNDDQVALERVVDRLLNSPRFGERWGRHWLDVVRYSESSGGGRTLLFPNAWRYRDYVIRAFNDDLPYDQFLTEQIAGDLLPSDDWRQTRRRITATAFLVMGATNYELQDKDVLEMDIVDEQLDTLGKAFLGMTIGCARCHDHKFDPIPTRDYYAMAGIFKSTKSVVHDNVSKWPTTNLPLSPEEEARIREHERHQEQLQSQLELLKQKRGKHASRPNALPGIVVDDVHATQVGSWTSSTHTKGFVGSNYLFANGGTDEASIAFEFRVANPGPHEIWLNYTPQSNRTSRASILIEYAGGQARLSVDQRQPGSVYDTVQRLIRLDLAPNSKVKVVIDAGGSAAGAVIADAVALIPVDELEKASQAVADVDRRKVIAKEIEQLEQQLQQLKADGPRRHVAMSVADLAEVGDIPVAIRGVVHNSGDVVSRGVLEVANPPSFDFQIADGQSGRLQLARWMTDTQHPLTSRVMANRVWHWLFGRGIVASVDNLGSTGATPTHPELLDHLADKLIEQDWSVKRLIRYIVLSRTFRLGSEPTERGIEIDPNNRLYWRMNRHRMEAEEIRDTMLQVSGELDMTQGGPTIRPGTKSEYGYTFELPRRSVYLPVFRNTLPQIMAAFDFADPNIQMGDRTESTIAPQALLLMNSPFVIDQTRRAAAKLLSEYSDSTTERRIEMLFLRVLGRAPLPGERSAVLQYVGSSNDIERWGMVIQTLLQSVDFRYVR